MKRASAPRRKAGEPAPASIFDELPTYVGYQVRRTQAKIFAEFEATLAATSTSRRARSAC